MRRLSAAVANLLLVYVGKKEKKYEVGEEDAEDGMVEEDEENRDYEQDEEDRVEEDYKKDAEDGMVEEDEEDGMVEEDREDEEETMERMKRVQDERMQMLMLPILKSMISGASVTKVENKWMDRS